MYRLPHKNKPLIYFNPGNKLNTHRGFNLVSHFLPAGPYFSISNATTQLKQTLNSLNVVVYCSATSN